MGVSSSTANCCSTPLAAGLGTGRILDLWHIVKAHCRPPAAPDLATSATSTCPFVGVSATIVTGTTFIFVREPY
jgi:hypothetical protein